MNSLRERVIFRMDKLGLNPSSLARILRETYGLKRTKQSTIQSLTSGRTNTFRKMNELAGALMTTMEWLSTGKGSENLETVEKEFDLPVKVVDRNFQFEGGSIPVLGVANGSSEALVLNFDEPIGKVARHPSQSGMKGAFAFEPRGESMSPRYEAGDMCFAISNKQPAKETDCLVELENGEAYLKRFIKRTDKYLICSQFNPPKEWKRPLSEVKAIHAVVGRG